MQRITAVACAFLLGGCTEADPCFAPPFAPSCPVAGEDESSSGPATGDDDSSSGPAKPDLVAWYRFDDGTDGAIDSSGNGFDAQCSQNCPERSPGVEGQAMFNDAEAFLTVAVPDVFAPEALTLSAWIRDDSATDDSTTNMILAKPYLADFDNSYRLHTRDFEDDGSRDLIFRIGGDLAPEQLLTFDIGDRLGQWTHVAGTWDGATMALYVQGEPVGTIAADVIEYDEQPLVIGADLNAFESDNYWEGAIDEARFHRRALSPSEVAALAQ